MKNFLLHVALVVTSIFSILLIIAHLAPFISPNLTVFPQFLGIIYPYLLITNIIIAIVWAVNRKWIFIIPFFSILIGFNHVISVFGLHFFETETLQTSKPIKVVSFNVRLFDLYNWSKNKDTRNKIMQYIKDLNADVICFQEYYDDKTNEFETTSLIMKLPKMKYYKIAPSYVAKDLYRFGIATFSKYPIVKSGEITFKNSQNNCLYTDLLINGETIRVYNIHLQSNHFDTENYGLLRQLNNNPTSIEFKKVQGIFGRLSKAYRKRSEQARQVAKHIEKSKYPTIICADLNDTYLSYAYRKVRGSFNDAFRKSGFGFGNTYGNLLASVRIDYMFYDDNFTSTSFNIGKGKLSDHKAIICTLERNKKP